MARNNNESSTTHWRIYRAIDELYFDENGNPSKDSPRYMAYVLSHAYSDSTVISVSVTDDAGNNEMEKELRKVVVGDDAFAESIRDLLEMSKEKGLVLLIPPRNPKNNVYENEKA